MRTRAFVPAVLGLAFLAGCAKKAPPDPYVGNMSDTSYAGLVTPESIVRRMSAAGREVAMTEFSGRFVWADYAAPWCGPCANQAQVMKGLEAAHPEVVFLTIMTSKSTDYEDVPDRATAQAWAGRFGFRADRVLVATNLWSRTIPTHILFSPEGHALYRWTGGLPAATISQVLNSRTAAWKRWSETGEKAEWMR